MKNYLLGFCLLISALGFGQRKATVIRVVDGDTFVVKFDKGGDTVKIRASYMNTPEGKNSVCNTEQEFYLEAKEEAETVLLNKKVLLYMANVMSWDREIARIKCVDKKYKYYDVWMINRGLSWSFIQNNPKHYQYRLQLKAKKKKIGLWNPLLYLAGEVPIDPSIWLQTHSTRH
jgi:endonuclease YncB( thermonuclease family)